MDNLTSGIHTYACNYKIMLWNYTSQNGDTVDSLKCGVMIAELDDMYYSDVNLFDTDISDALKAIEQRDLQLKTINLMKEIDMKFKLLH